MVAEPTSPARPTRADATRNRARVLQAAREVFARDGYDATLHDIARHAEVGVGTVYRHFRNRDEILDELFDESMARLERVGEEALSCADPWDGLVQFIERSAEMMRGDRGLWTLAIGGRSKARHLERGRLHYWRTVPELLTRAKTEGTLRDDLATEDLSVISVMIGTSAMFTGPQSPEAWRRYLTIVLDGLRAARSGPTRLPVAELSFEQLNRAMSDWYPETH
jgi:AcrR family transcriptional regulator